MLTPEAVERTDLPLAVDEWFSFDGPNLEQELLLLQCNTQVNTAKGRMIWQLS